MTLFFLSLILSVCICFFSIDNPHLCVLFIFTHKQVACLEIAEAQSLITAIQINLVTNLEHINYKDTKWQRRLSFPGDSLTLLFFLLLARCRHTAGRHDRQVSQVIGPKGARRLSWLHLTWILFWLFFRRYSGSGSSGAASMRKVRADRDPAVILLYNGLNCLNGTNLVCTHLWLYLNVTSNLGTL